MNFEAGNGNWWRPCNHEKTLQFSRTYFSLTMLKYFPFLRSQIKQMIEGLYFSKNTGVHYLILDSVFPFSKEISYIWMFSPSACFVTTWLSVDSFHSVVFILCKYRRGESSSLSWVLKLVIPLPVKYHNTFDYSSISSSTFKQLCEEYVVQFLGQLYLLWTLQRIRRNIHKAGEIVFIST